MTNRRAVFLDVDGTLIDEVGQVPASAAEAIRGARAHGHLVLLSTGRSLVELWPRILDIGFDGLIAASGAYVSVGGEVLVRHRLSPRQVDHVAGFFADNGVDCYFQAEDGVYATSAARSHLRRLIRSSISDESLLAELEDGLFGFIDSIRVEADPREASITKVIYFDSPLGLDRIRAEFAPDFEVIPSSVPLFGPHSGEMSLAGVHKASGIDVVLDHLGIDRSDTIALGDSYNDLEMLAHVGTGIAMGNAPEAVKEVADEVTTAPEEDGIMLAFRRHGLLG